jgi:dTDP-4-amino-4,6-dideoxygalactose transaminase
MRGHHTSELETQLGAMLQGMKVVCVGNGTDALVLSLLSLGIKSGEKVATVANAGGYATGAILRIGAVPVMVDNVIAGIVNQACILEYFWCARVFSHL